MGRRELIGRWGAMVEGEEKVLNWTVCSTAKPSVSPVIGIQVWNGTQQEEMIFFFRMSIKYLGKYNFSISFGFTDFLEFVSSRMLFSEIFTVLLKIIFDTLCCMNSFEGYNQREHIFSFTSVDKCYLPNVLHTHVPVCDLFLEQWSRNYQRAAFSF